MTVADEILAELLDLDVEHPRYLSNGMRLCYWCANAWTGTDTKGREFPANHTSECPWARARKWGAKKGKRQRTVDVPLFHDEVVDVPVGSAL